MTVSIYLSGAITNDKVNYSDWRSRVPSYTGANWVDPTEGITYQEAREISPEDLVKRDRGLIDKSDAVLVRYMHGVETPGTWREVEYAIQTQKPVAIWHPEFDDPPETVSPWVHEAGFMARELYICVLHLNHEVYNDG